MGDIRGRVLIVAGSDSGGGAGIQADIKTVTALGGYAATAVTALTAQNTEGVAEVRPVEANFVAHQMRLVLDDIGADCIKLGMLFSTETITAVCDVVEAVGEGIPLVVDPVMVAKDGCVLLEEEALDILKQRLIPLTTLFMPNIPEAENLTGITLRDIDDMRRAAGMLTTLGARVVMLKGGHMGGDVLTDLLHWDGCEKVFEDKRVDHDDTHGTGCPFASAVAVGLAQGMGVHAAVVRARNYLREAILTAPSLGHGQGPLNHVHNIPYYTG